MLLKITDFYTKHKFYINSDFIVHISEMYPDRTDLTKVSTYIKTSHNEFNVLETPEEIIKEYKGN